MCLGGSEAAGNSIIERNSQEEHILGAWDLEGFTELLTFHLGVCEALEIVYVQNVCETPEIVCKMHEDFFFFFWGSVACNRFPKLPGFPGLLEIMRKGEALHAVEEMGKIEDWIRGSAPPLLNCE